jgi:putative resolvase
VVAEVAEIAPGLNDERPTLMKLLTDARVGVIVVEHRDRLARVGYGSSAAHLEHAGRRVAAILPSDPSDPTDTGTDLVDDFMAVSTRRHAYGGAPLWATQRQAARRTDSGVRQTR